MNIEKNVIDRVVPVENSEGNYANESRREEFIRLASKLGIAEVIAAFLMVGNPEVNEATQVRDRASIELGEDTKRADKPPSSRFIPPAIEEIRSYCAERNNQVDAEQFFDYYSARGWMLNKTKMKDWKAAIRTWERRVEKKENQGGQVDDYWA